MLEKLIDNDEIYVHKYLVQTNSLAAMHEHSKQQQDTYIYKYAEPVDFFVLIVEGCLVVEAGAEKTEFLAKQFDHFGSRALLGECETRDQVIENAPEYRPYTPEYSLKIDYDHHLYQSADETLNILLYLKLDRNLWLQAVKATSFKRTYSEITFSSNAGGGGGGANQHKFFV